MNVKKDHKSALRIKKGISQQPCINPNAPRDSGSRRPKKYSVDEYVDGILSGNMTILSQAITLIESSLPEHNDIAQNIIEKCLPFNPKSVRIGITGAPGTGKSTFIETFGLNITDSGRKLAVLTIDPSSGQSKGSILGDKTRMEKLSIHPNAYIRPSPASGKLGGIARKTREAIILCESAGFSTIIVETVGVGQSETDVRSIVDCFVLLMLAGAGDELQGIKRGIMEMADLIAITKADGVNKTAADTAKVILQNAVQMFPLKSSGWHPQVVTCSSIYNNGIRELWDLALQYFEFTTDSGYFEEQRKEQEVSRMHSTIVDFLKSSFYNNEEVKVLLPEYERQLLAGKLTSYKAAAALIDKYAKG